MNRRNFLHFSCISTMSMVLLGESIVYADNTMGTTYVLTMEFDLSVQKGDQCSLWVPLPNTIEGFQRVIDTTYTLSDGKGEEFYFKTLGARYYFVKWNSSERIRRLKIEISVAVQDRTASFYPINHTRVIDKDVREFLLPTAHVPHDPYIDKVTRRVIGNTQAPLEKARKIYDWIVHNTYRDENIRGCGIGYPVEMIKQFGSSGKMGGKCFDISSLCVAMMRSAGIPAREVVGLRVGASRLSNAFGTGENVTSAQHCKVEFFIEGLGWIPCDPADISKLVLKENLSIDSERVKELSGKFFGFWEKNWIALNYARDFDLFPANAQGKLDQFNYPYGEIDGEYIESYDPKNFRYSFHSAVQGI
ncbi:MAG: hypothetical protein CJD30_09920 [Sulfuricurvum sp. PD_MW2]|uniref:transglutaminase-like domain-containing protein n=1 Tax=Sulfuricurvum sp. PD_MW2 TaxID=2027917 RepID=UPI000C05E5EF|nr:transglutaminase family protein [Sulfuricurvum sp. PD_MW2]PHM16765.1 MAG: hypothetical protein CJD30_09920 [Sulfuricurvum sp. PD_MW2]